jgi:hypothetical protein
MNEKGQSLLVAILVILAMSMAAGVWIVSGKFVKDEESYKITTERLIRIARAIRPMDFSKYGPSRSYTQDAGQMPTALTALISNSDAIGACALSNTTRQLTGWCGPYLTTAFSGDNNFLDGWGRAAIYNTSTCTIKSYGPDGVSGADDLIHTLGVTAYQNQILTDDPVVYYKLDEISGATAKDSAQGLDGTILNNVTLQQATALLGASGYAMLFSGGASDTVQVVGTSAIDIRGPVSIEAWVKPNVDPVSGSDQTLVQGGVGPTDNKYALNISNGGRLGYHSYSTQFGGWGFFYSNAAVVTSGSWQHVVVTRGAGESISFYVNGSSAGTATGWDVTPVTMGSLYIGANGNAGLALSGSLDEVAIYPYTLTSGQVLSHYQIGKCIK